MHLIDTNYLVRLAADDNPEQGQIVLDFLEKSAQNDETVLISVVSVFELIWVLNKVYLWEEKSVMSFLEKIYMSRWVKFENEEILVAAIEQSQQNSLGLEDNYNIALAKLRNLNFHSFDKRAVKVFESQK